MRNYLEVYSFYQCVPTVLPDRKPLSGHLRNAPQPVDKALSSTCRRCRLDSVLRLGMGPIRCMSCCLNSLDNFASFQVNFQYRS
jgi:hypothetical protein